MNSEVELHDAIQELRAVATAPDLYPIMVELQSIGSLLGLLSHDNTDISVAVVDLLQELTDVDTLHESVEGTAALVQDLSDNQVRTFLTPTPCSTLCSITWLGIIFLLSTWICKITQFFLPPMPEERRKTMWSELESNPDPLASQATTLTTRPCLLWQMLELNDTVEHQFHFGL